MKFLIIYVFALLLPLACSNNDSGVESASMVEEMSAPMGNDIEDKSVTDSSEPVTESKIIKTSNLRFETENINDSYVGIQKLITEYKANIQNDVTGKDNSSSYRNITIRISNIHFTPFINDLSKGVKYFDRKEISSQDVTEQYIDLEARMNAKKNLEKRYIEILSKASKVSEILEIEKQLAIIREEIESKEGQLKYLKSQIAMSTINIEMYTNNASESGVTVSYSGKIWNAIKSGFNGLSSFMLGLITIWPFILILALIIYFIKKRFFKKKTD